MGSDFDTVWDALDLRFQESLKQAWMSLRRGGLPVGCVVAKGNEVVSVGRNRVYDPPGGVDQLQQTPIAHAEMNALAALSNDLDASACEVWSTHSPCSMCRAATNFVGVRSVRFLASDPSSDEASLHPWSTDADDEVWIVVANSLFLHNVARVGSRDNPIVRRSLQIEPEVTSLALDLSDRDTLVLPSSAYDPVTNGLERIWTQIQSTHLQRTSRVG